MSELKPCPFCGSSKIKSHDYGNVELLYRCEDCGGEHFHSNWNTRPIEDALQARIAELEAENQRIKKEIFDWMLLEADELTRHALSEIMEKELKYESI